MIGQPCWCEDPNRDGIIYEQMFHQTILPKVFKRTQNSWRRIGSVHAKYKWQIPVEHRVESLLTKVKPPQHVSHGSCPDYVVLRQNKPHVFVELKTVDKNYYECRFYQNIILSKGENDYFMWLKKNYQEHKLFFIIAARGGNPSEFKVCDFNDCEYSHDTQRNDGRQAIVFKIMKFIELKDFMSTLK